MICPICGGELVMTSDAPSRPFCRTNPLHIGVANMNRPGTREREVTDLLVECTKIWPALWSVDLDSLGRVVAARFTGDAA